MSDIIKDDNNAEKIVFLGQVLISPSHLIYTHKYCYWITERTRTNDIDGGDVFDDVLDVIENKAGYPIRNKKGNPRPLLRTITRRKLWYRLRSISSDTLHKKLAKPEEAEDVRGNKDEPWSVGQYEKVFAWFRENASNIIQDPKKRKILTILIRRKDRPKSTQVKVIRRTLKVANTTAWRWRNEVHGKLCNAWNDVCDKTDDTNYRDFRK